MSTVDDRVVEMKFNNAEFERGVKTTLASLANLNKGLQLQGATKGLQDVSNAAGRISLGPLSSGLDAVRVKFGLLQTVGVTAIANLTTKAMAFFKTFTGFSIISSGFSQYQQQINATQTILANTASNGSTLKDVTNTLATLNDYANRTIYNFSDMATNLGTFTAAGIKLKPAADSIQGLSNIAAAAGAGTQQAAGAMYQLSQALGRGKLIAQDWNSVVNAGMASSNFKKALLETGRALGTIKMPKTESVDQWIKKGGSFQEVMSKGQITTKVLTQTFQVMAGTMSDAEMKQKGYTAAQIKASHAAYLAKLAHMGYNKEQIKSISLLAAQARAAAVNVKTFTALKDNLQQGVSSSWAQVFKTLIGDLPTATKLFTNLSQILNGIFVTPVDNLNVLLKAWSKLGGLKALDQGIINSFRAIGAVIKPIKAAFREIFPPKTAAQLLGMAAAFRDFTAKLKIGATTASELKRTFAGVFAIFSIAGQIFSGVIGALKPLFKVISNGSGGVLNFTAGIGDFLVSLNEMLKRSGAIQTFFANIDSYLSVPFHILAAVAALVRRLFSNFDKNSADGIINAANNVSDRFHPLLVLGEKISNLFKNIGKIFVNAGKKIGEGIAHIGDAIGKAITPQTFSQTLDVINTALLGGIALMFKRFFSKGVKVDVGGGMFAQIKTALISVTDTMKAMQTSIKADTMLKIAGALALLTASILVLSQINSKDLTKALVTMGLMFAGLQIALVKLASAIGPFKAVKLAVLSVALIGLSTAMLLLTLSMKLMASMNLGDMLRGLLGMGLALKVISTVMATMPKGMVLQAVALNLLAVALTAIAVALKLFATLSWSDMAHGLTAMVGALAGIAVAMRLMPKGILLQSVALVALSVALNAIAGAVKIFATMSWNKMVHGLAGMAGALVGIASAMYLMPKGMLIQAAALIAVGVALNIIAGAIKIMATMSWTEIGKGLTTLAGALIILAGGLYLMSGTLAGAAALLVAAGALAILTPVLVTLGNLKWSTIIKSLVALAGVFLILGVAGLALAEVVPVILALGVAMALIGAGLALAGVGALAFATAFGIVVGAGAAGVAVLTNVLKVIVDAIPMALGAVALGLANFAKVLLQNAPTFFAAMTTILMNLINAVIVTIPRIGVLFLSLVNMAIHVLRVSIPRLAAAGLAMLLGVLTAIRDNIGQIVTVVGDLIVNFITALEKTLPKVIDAGVKFIISFIRGLAAAIRNNTDDFYAAADDLAKAILEGLAKGLLNGASLVEDAAKGVAKGALNAAKHFLGISSPSKEFEKIGNYVNQGFAKGLKGNRQEVFDAFNTLKQNLADAVNSSKQDIDDAEKRLKKLTAAKHKDKEAIKETIAALAEARKEYALTSTAYSTLTKDLVDERDKLGRLANQYNVVTNRLDAANQKLADAKRTRDDYSASIRDQYDQLPNIDKTTRVAIYAAELKKQIADTAALASGLQALRKRGLNDNIYKELLAKGTDALPFVQELLKGGSDKLVELNMLGSQLDAQAKALGNSASKSLYQAAVNSAAGLVAGLKAQQANIQKQMNIIAASMVKAIKIALGIKSPSREFAKLGVFTGQGLAEGLRKSSVYIDKAAIDVSESALESMRRSISDMSKLADEHMDVTPRIIPVLDLTNVKKDSAQIGNLLTSKPISVEATYSNARAALVSHNQNKMAAQIDLPPQAQRNLTFNQYNNSPKALSEATIYRQTKNQLSVVKEALKT